MGIDDSRGTWTPPTKETLAQFLDRWLKDYVETHTRARTAEGYRHKLERHVIPALGSTRLSALQPSHIQGFYRQLLEAGRLDGKGGLSPRSVLHIHRILHDALAAAVKWGEFTRNPAQAVDPPRPRKKEMAVLDPEGVRRVLQAAQGSMWHPVFHLAIYSGLRRSELLGLRWKDIDLSRATLTVVQVLHQLRDGRIIVDAPKTSSGSRSVALSPSAVLALRAHRERTEAIRDDLGYSELATEDLVFAREGQERSSMLPGSVSQAWRKLVRRTGYANIRFHDLRHTHASLMLRQGVHPKIVSERLGHANIGITLDTYSHVLPGLQEAAAASFEEGLAEPTPVEASG